MRGYSHVFVSGPSDAPECSDFVAVAETESAWQEVFSRTRLRELVLGYSKDANPMPIRKVNAGADIWMEQTYRKPSERIQIVHRRKFDVELNPEGGLHSASNTQGTHPMSVPNSAMTTPNPVEVPTSPAAASVTIATDAWSCAPVGELIAGYQGGSQDSADDEKWLHQIEGKSKGALQQFQLQSKLVSSVLNICPIGVVLLPAVILLSMSLYSWLSTKGFNFTRHK